MRALKFIIAWEAVVGLLCIKGGIIGAAIAWAVVGIHITPAKAFVLWAAIVWGVGNILLAVSCLSPGSWKESSSKHYEGIKKGDNRPGWF